MKPWTRALKLAVPLALAMQLPAGCARTTATVAIDTGVTCRVFEPIGWSVADSGQTVRSVKEHNAAWDALCRKPEAKR